MTRERSLLIGWLVLLTLLGIISIPWFMWGSSQLTYGIPMYVWWYGLISVLATGLFVYFAQHHWDNSIVHIGLELDE